MFVDAEHDQNEFGRDAGEDHAHKDRGKAGEDENETGERIGDHDAQSGYHGGKSKQDRNDDRQPIKDLNDRWGDEPLPLEQIVDVEHS